jgi:hypothetical protein
MLWLINNSCDFNIFLSQFDFITLIWWLKNEFLGCINEFANDSALRIILNVIDEGSPLNTEAHDWSHG